MNVRAIALMAGLTSVLPGTGLVLGAEWVQAAKVASDQPYQQEFFGNTVAVSGSFAAVGTLNYNSGCGYIFECDSGVWGIAEKLDNGQIPTRQFGCSVAISENLALFGASGEPGGGAAYLYRREASGWTQEARLVPTGMQSGNYFGYSVAVSGEFAVVGAPGAIYGDSLAGEAFLFHRGSQGWSQVAKLSVAGTTHLGVRVSLTDGYALLGSCSEAAYVFQYDQFQVTGPVPLSGTDTIPGDHFGRDACTIDGNYAVVGAALDDDRGENAGAAYVFQRQGNDWREVQRLEALDSAANSYFGTSASLRGDVLVIGADYTSPGSAYVFRCDGGGIWSEEQRLQAADGVGHDYFGWAVSTDGTSIVVGAFANNQAGVYSGAAYVFVPEPATLSLLAVGGLALIRRKRMWSDLREHRDCPECP